MPSQLCGPERLDDPDFRDRSARGDATETGWTSAVAARMLRRAGAEGVLPLVLAVQA
ncbi:hypothetical protein [Streptomyces sp. TP-A0356]|uniref:hypothetical protein n=1 Tax=Streptomyces sp. TP-A0356 TaxID=1359208 RepID=UPI000A480194|nr:hypothetical protein [Streptomyces sp. TP-A0356]